MRTQRNLLLPIIFCGALLGSLSLLPGCGRSSTKPVASPKPTAKKVRPRLDQPVASVRPSRESASDATKTAAVDSGKQPVPNEETSKPTDGDSKESVPTEAVATKPVEPPAPPISKERVVLLLPLNPLIIEFQLTIDGRPHTEALEKLVEDVSKMADTDGDGRPTWREVTSSKRFKYGQFGNVAVNNENDYKQVIELYDIDRDGLVDRSELPRFLTRNAGGSRAFSVRGTADFRNSNRRSAALWKLLDADDDGTLTAEELSAGPPRLLSRDMDDDEVLAAADLDQRVALDPGMMTQRRRRGPEIIKLISTSTNWDSVRLALEEEYAGGGYLRADSFPLTPSLFTQLDANNDGKVLKAEFQRLADVDPHLVIAAGFGQATPPPAAEEPMKDAEAKPAEEDSEADKPEEDAAKPDEKATRSLRLVRLADEFALGNESPLEQSGRLTLLIAGTTITFFLNDTIAAADFEAQAQQALMALDGDKNGYLESKEVPENAAPQLGRFEAVDTDEDDKVYPGEIVAFLKQQQAGLRAQIHVRASDREDVLFSALDQNRDERLDAREIAEISSRLTRFDRSKDGLITTDELPESLLIGLARGSLENMDGLFTVPPLVAQAPADDTPRWFTQMDANGDGAISRREFIGPPEKFQPLDTSGDDLIDAVEAKAAK